jgi:uncharacterized BrkB/YihY/UPF0761 family membrane protein
MTLPPPPGTAPASGAPARRPVVVWDLVTTIVLLVVGVVIAAALTFAAFFLVFASDPCGATDCDTDRMGAGFLVALLGPAAITLVAVVAAVILLVLRRIAFWVPIAGILLAVGVWVLGAALVISGVPGATF